ncbi:hypothetical protein FRE64_07630 [Euhalothece natronophila Z-M001]|uniref:ParM/StbA family protein n=1 Tax=Euhalothece natronophila Z-M001 TaxID=522448 RepID=A0A5B8NKP7_9CHRO|nr:hypothetical protein [Euhalothece natronophila]QDZ39822.1 hypothetical protein FRE64_07630 [Euhalothece natronophila Z-M001]
MDAEVKAGSREKFIEDIGKGGYPEDRCWIKVSENKDCALGYLAKKHEGQSQMNQSKFMKAVFKTVGLISAIAAREEITNKTLKVDLTSFLPYSERNNFPDYFEALKEFVKNPIETEFGSINIEFINLVRRVEGQGIYHSLSPSEKNNKKVAIMMMGYRNVSLVIGERGTIQKGATTDLGMVKLANEIGESEGITNEGILTKFLVEAKTNEDRALSRLLAKETGYKKAERKERLKKKIAELREDFASQLITWMKDELDQDVDKIVLTGGSAMYFGKQIENQIKKNFPWMEIGWNNGLDPEKDLGVIRNLGQTDQYKRYIDVYGEYLYNQAVIAEKKNN